MRGCVGGRLWAWRGIRRVPRVAHCIIALEQERWAPVVCRLCRAQSALRWATAAHGHWRIVGFRVSLTTHSAVQ
jgi:hypothetical protein